MTGLYHGWSYEPDTHADFIHGGVPVEDFEPEVKHKKKATHKKPKRGCPGNDFKEHVYVWVSLNWTWTDKKYEREICAGCEKRRPRGKVRQIR